MRSFSITNVGQVRKVNQDFLYANEEAIGNLPNLFIVADGMGGHRAGDLASRYCVETLVKLVQENELKTPVSILSEAIRGANEAVYQKAAENPDYEGMGTTLVAAVVKGNMLYAANIGDSRLYLLNREMEQITEDHSWVEEMVKKGELTEEEMRFHPNKNIITRAVGTSENVEADFFEVEVLPGDRILMCSDGLCNMVDDEEIFKIARSRKEELPVIGEKLVKKANENGGKDNIAIVLVEI